MLRRLELVDMDAAALVFRTAFDHALASLAGLHTPQRRSMVLPGARVLDVRGLGCFRWPCDDRNDRLSGGLDRSILRAAKGSGPWRGHGALASRPALF